MNWPFRNLSTPKLQLRPLSETDIQAYFDLFSDAETMAYWSDEPIATIAEAREKLADDIRWANSDEALCWGIALPESGRLLGKVNLYFFSRHTVGDNTPDRTYQFSAPAIVKSHIEGQLLIVLGQFDGIQNLLSQT